MRWPASSITFSSMIASGSAAASTSPATGTRATRHRRPRMSRAFSRAGRSSTGSTRWPASPTNRVQLTRLYLSPAHKAAALQVLAWMGEAGMEARIDAVGNVVGRYEGIEPGLPAAAARARISTPSATPASMTATSASSPPSAAVADLHRRGERLPFAIEVLAFGDEEGVALSGDADRLARRGGHLRPGGARCTRCRRHHAPRGAGSIRLRSRRHRRASRAAATRCRWAMSRCISSRGRCSRPRTCRSAS